MMSGSRIIKGDLPLRYWKETLYKRPGTKVFQTMRNPTLVSMHHFMKNNKIFGSFNGSWNDFQSSLERAFGPH